MLWRCEAKRNNAREIIVGGVSPPLSDNLKRNMLQGEHLMEEFLTFLVTVVLPLAGILAFACFVRAVLPNPFSGGCGG